MKKSILLATVAVALCAVGSSQAKRVAGAVTEKISVRVENKTNRMKKVEVTLSRFFGAHDSEETLLGKMEVHPPGRHEPKRGLLGAYWSTGTATRTFQIPPKDLKRMESMMQSGTYLKAKMRAPVMGRVERVGGSTYSIVFKIDGEELKDPKQRPRLNRTPAIFTVTITKDGVTVNKAMI